MVRLIKILMLILIPVLAIGAAGCSSSPELAAPSAPDRPAPDFQLQNLDGQSVSLSSFRGRPVMLNFWASWCGPCRAEMPFIQAVFEDEEWTQQGLVVLAVNIGESSSTALEFMEDNGLTFTVLLDTDQSVAQYYGIRAIPTTFFIDKNGIIKYREIGAFASKAEIDRRLISNILDSG